MPRKDFQHLHQGISCSGAGSPRSSWSPCCRGPRASGFPSRELLHTNHHWLPSSHPCEVYLWRGAGILPRGSPPPPSPAWSPWSWSWMSSSGTRPRHSGQTRQSQEEEHAWDQQPLLPGIMWLSQFLSFLCTNLFPAVLLGLSS